MLIVPPGGFAGFSQMTPASRQALTPTTRGSATRRRRSRKATGTAKRKRGAKRASGGGRKLKFGSPAWRKKYAAKAARNAKKARSK